MARLALGGCPNAGSPRLAGSGLLGVYWSVSFAPSPQHVRSVEPSARQSSQHARHARPTTLFRVSAACPNPDASLPDRVNPRPAAKQSCIPLIAQVVFVGAFCDPTRSGFALLLFMGRAYCEPYEWAGGYVLRSLGRATSGSSRAQLRAMALHAPALGARCRARHKFLRRSGDQ